MIAFSSVPTAAEEWHNGFCRQEVRQWQAENTLRAHELALLQELRSYLQSLSATTDLMSSKIPSLSLTPLVRAEISDACKSCTEDSDELKSLTDDYP